MVKVRRPGIEEQVELDLELLRSTAALLERRSQTAAVLQLDALAEELEAHLTRRARPRRGGHNTELIAEIVAEPSDLVVPQVIRPYVTERVLVLERIVGERVSPDHGLPPERAPRSRASFFGFYVRQVTLARRLPRRSAPRQRAS